MPIKRGTVTLPDAGRWLFRIARADWSNGELPKLAAQSDPRRSWRASILSPS